MAKKTTIEERRQRMLLELKKLEEEQKREHTAQLIKLGKQAELLLNGMIDFPVFINEAETITGWKFKGQVPRHNQNSVQPVVASETA
jgi:ribosomal protein S1